MFYPNAEGIDVFGNELFFVSKVRRTLYILNLDGTDYATSTSRSGLFDGRPDQIQRVVEDDSLELLYFTEDGGSQAGVHTQAFTFAMEKDSF